MQETRLEQTCRLQLARETLTTYIHFAAASFTRILRVFLVAGAYDTNVVLHLIPNCNLDYIPPIFFFKKTHSRRLKPSTAIILSHLLVVLHDQG